MKRLLLAATAALVLAPAALAASPSTGHATVACRNRIINEWEGTGKIRTTYPLACYTAALKYVNGHADLSEYSSMSDDIRLALRAARSRSRGGSSVPLLVGKHYGKGTGKGSKTTTTTPDTGTTTTTPAPNGIASSDSGSSGGGGTPLPLIILGALALVLIAAGAIGGGLRYARNRRGPGGPGTGPAV